MPWRIENGYPVKHSVHTDPPPPELEPTREFDEAAADPDLLFCPECGKDYRTRQGLDNHLETKH